MQGVRRAVQAPAARAPLGQVQTRGMASEQALKLRIGTVQNVKKITSTMKMVAAAKLRGAQRTLDVARVFCQMSKEWQAPEDLKVSAEEKHMVVGITSDKGLCGGINSSIVRAIRDQMIQYKKKDGNKGENTKFVILGNKGVQGLERLHGDKFSSTIGDMGKLTFSQALQQTDVILSEEFTTGEVWYQYFRSMMSYDTTRVPIQSFEAATESGDVLPGYKFWGHPQDVLLNFYDFKTALDIFLFQSETETSTLSSRMNAMEGSSKNAGEMLDALTLQLNRSRQARITTELIEIISGASAAEEQQG